MSHNRSCATFSPTGRSGASLPACGRACVMNSGREAQKEAKRQARWLEKARASFATFDGGAGAERFLNHLGTLRAQGISAGGCYFNSGKSARVDIYILKAARADRPECGARCRDGHSCRARVTLDSQGRPRKRCRMHGGQSTGPRTPEGRAAIAKSNRRRAKERTG